MAQRTGQATLEYVVALAMTVFFVALLLAQIDAAIRQWWDLLARRIAAPCPTQECIERTPSTVPTP